MNEANPKSKAEIESTQNEKIETADMEAAVYKHHGGDEKADIVATVKAHHAEKHDCSPTDLIGRKLASGGGEHERTYVAIIEWSV